MVDKPFTIVVTRGSMDSNDKHVFNEALDLLKAKVLLSDTVPSNISTYWEDDGFCIQVIFKKYEENIMDDDEPHRMEYVDKADTRFLKLQAENDKLRKIINRAKDELGVPSSDYPAPVANAVQILNEA